MLPGNGFPRNRVNVNERLRTEGAGYCKKMVPYHRAVTGYPHINPGIAIADRHLVVGGRITKAGQLGEDRLANWNRRAELQAPTIHIDYAVRTERIFRTERQHNFIIGTDRQFIYYHEIM